MLDRSVHDIDMQRGLSVLLLTCVYEHSRLVSSAAFTVQSLPEGYSYTVAADPDDDNFCECNTVTYSLLSACDACMGNEWFSYGSDRLGCPFPKSLVSRI